MYEFNITLLLKDINAKYWNQGYISSRTGISQSSISRIFAGTKEPSINEFLDICDLLEKTPFEYFKRVN